MKIDNRLERAFSDLENRVSNQLNTRSNEVPERQHRGPSYVALGIAVATAVVAIVVVIVVFRPANSVAPVDSGPSPSQPAIVDPSPPQEALPDQVPATAPEPGTVDEVAPLAIIGSSDGIVGYGPERVAVLSGQPAMVARPTREGGFVYQTIDDLTTLRYLDPTGKSSVMTTEAAPIRMLGMLDAATVLHTVAAGTDENRREVLYATTLLGSTVALAPTAGGEGSIFSASGFGDLLVVQTGSEGLLFTNGFALGGGIVDLPGLPETECVNGFDSVGLCYWYTTISDDGTRFVSLFWSGAAAIPAELVVTAVDTGDEQYRIFVGPGQFTGIDVAWPNVVVNNQIVVDGDWAPGQATVISFDGEPSIVELSDPGIASAGY